MQREPTELVLENVICNKRNKVIELSSLFSDSEWEDLVNNNRMVFDFFIDENMCPYCFRDLKKETYFENHGSLFEPWLTEKITELVCFEHGALV